MVAPINGYQNQYNFFQIKPVNEREAKPVYGGGENFFVNPRAEYTPSQKLFSDNTSGLSSLVANSAIGEFGAREIRQNIPGQEGREAGISNYTWVG